MLLGVALIVSSCAGSRFMKLSEYRSPSAEYQPKGHLESILYAPTNQNISEKRMMVYLPEGYQTSGKSYPVLYLLHGAQENEISWINHGEVMEIMDELAASDRSKECIVVMPNMNNYRDDEDYAYGRELSMMQCVTSVTGGMEGSFMHDVVMRIDSLYRTIPDREHRAICGLSIGSLQSLFITANNPQDFGYLGMFSPFSKAVGRHEFYSGRKAKLDTLFLGPNPPHCELYVGTWDIVYNHACAFAKEWKSKGYPYEFHTMSGRHDWPVWRAGLRSFSASLWE